MHSGASYSLPEADGAGRLRAETHAFTAWPELQGTWENLREECAGSFFVGALWVKRWLETFGPALAPRLMVFRSDGVAVGMALVVRRLRWRHGLPVRRIHLNAAGENEEDEVCTEFNTLLCRPGFESRVVAALLDRLPAQGWDEIALHGFTEGAALDAFRSALAATFETDRALPSHHVDLDALRRSGLSVLASLSPKVRKHLRQSQRRYAEAGPLRLEAAPDAPRRLDFLRELAALHQRSWKARGRPGVFASPRFSDFHQKLLESPSADTATDLLRVTVNDRTLGVLYSFRWGDTAYFYQSGLDYSDGPKQQPGMVSLLLALEHYEARGLRRFEFMAGDTLYKRVLSNGQSTLHWTTFGRRSVRMRLARAIRRWLRPEDAGLPKSPDEAASPGPSED